MTDIKVPHEVLHAIREAAEEEYGANNQSWIEEEVSCEIAAYRELQTLDFRSARAVREQIVSFVCENDANWRSRLSGATASIAAYEKLPTLNLQALSPEDTAELKNNASQQRPYDYCGQLEFIEREAVRVRHERDLRARVGPYIDLLIKMEGIIGRECYNQNIRNYGPGGVWEGDGRSFRYPVRYVQQGSVIESWRLDDPPDAALLLTGFYKFGANELSIFRGLLKIVEMLEADYGIDLRNMHRPYQSGVP